MPLPRFCLLCWTVDMVRGLKQISFTVSCNSHKYAAHHGLRDFWSNTLKLEFARCLLALTPQFIVSYQAKPLLLLLYLDHLKTFKALNGEGCKS